MRFKYSEAQPISHLDTTGFATWNSNSNFLGDQIIGSCFSADLLKITMLKKSKKVALKEFSPFEANALLTMVWLF